MALSMKMTVAYDATPTFRGLARMLSDARRHGWTGKLNSSDRRRGVAERYGKLSQAALYLGWLAHKAGFNPANAPGRSTHELRSDGKAYRGPVGRPLSWWQLGMDVTESDQLLTVLGKLGYKAFRPYATGSEVHHLNLKRSPWSTLRKHGLLTRHPKQEVHERPARLSSAGLNLIAEFEGLRLNAYKLSGEQYFTIGYGHYGADVKEGQRITKGRARSLLVADVHDAEAIVRTDVKVGISQARFDALVSLTYNIGGGAFAKSTLLRKLNAHDYPGASAEFMRWDRGSEGKVLEGLQRRRAAERKLFDS